MAGVPGFEPGHGGIRTRCLTAWLHPKAPILQPLKKLVREVRIELTHLTAPEPKSGAST